MSMTIAQVLYVLEIADCRSISAAAERQFISQSALSQQIQRLEGELGYPLFVRTPRGLTLTAAGETFCREARPVAEQWQRLCSAVKPDGRRGRSSTGRLSSVKWGLYEARRGACSRGVSSASRRGPGRRSIRSAVVVRLRLSRAKRSRTTVESLL